MFSHPFVCVSLLNLFWACFLGLLGRIHSLDQFVRSVVLFPYWAVLICFVLFWLIRFVLDRRAYELQRRFHVIHSPAHPRFPRNIGLQRDHQTQLAPQGSTPSGDITSASPITPQRTRFSFQHV
jgi:hypothetical protein